MDRMFESEEYASILNFVGYRRVGARVKKLRRIATFAYVLRRLLPENTRAVVLETCVRAEL
jgi:hypothetical protein